MGKDSTLVAAMAIPKPISSTLPPAFPSKRRHVGNAYDFLLIVYCSSLQLAFAHMVRHVIK